MLHRLLVILCACAASVLVATPGHAQSSFADTGTPQVAVSHMDNQWTISGKKNTVLLDARDLAVNVKAGPVNWQMLPSAEDDMLVSQYNERFHVRLADAGEIRVTPYETGYKTGVKLILDRFRSTGMNSAGLPVDLRLVFTICLEGESEDLVWEATAIERQASLKELHWPEAVDGREVDDTVISSDNGTLLPRDWPHAYSPTDRAVGEHSLIQSHLIETWSMSWWGFEKASSAMMLIVETPDDAGYTFSHPAGGPTKMGPNWLAQLGRFNYTRRVRMVFFPKGNYVTLAKRYREYVQNSGLFVSLKDKIAMRPVVKNLIGTAFAGVSIYRNVNPLSDTYNKKEPEKNVRLVTFEQAVQRLRDFKAQGFDHLNVSMSGWLKEGYDRQTPDALPPAPPAGGWQGMKAFFDACKEIGYVCWLHDQYRDYYIDAPSWNPDFAVHEEDSESPSTAFPGTRFQKDWKEGHIPLMNHWDGGTQGYLNNAFMLGHVEKNYRVMFEHGIHPRGSYQDVFGYIPPDQDFNPEHPSTRTDSMNDRIAVLHWVRNNLGIVGTEDGSDWVIPYVDYVTSRFNRGSNTGTNPDHRDAIPIPLYDLVYHDAVVTTDPVDNLRSFLYGHAAQLGYGHVDQKIDWNEARRLVALQARVGLLEMTNHEFLDKDGRRERTTFADGTTVTVDWDKNTVEIRPDVSPAN